MTRGAKIWISGVLLLVSGFATAAAAAERLYTAYNVWYESPQKLYSTNYSTGALLPAGSEVTGVVRGSKKLEFVDAKTNVKFTVEFVAKHNPGVTIEQFTDRFLTPKDFAQLTAGLSDDEIKAIKTGQVQVGMSKKAVLVARGYPPEIATPSIELDAWKYWYNRFKSYLVEFSNGKVSRTER